MKNKIIKSKFLILALSLFYLGGCATDKDTFDNAIIESKNDPGVQLMLAHKYLNSNQSTYQESLLIFNTDEKIRNDHKLGLKMLENLANNGNNQAMYELGDLYDPSYTTSYPIEKDLFDKNIVKAIEWYSKSAEYNNSNALIRLADIYEQEKDPITKKDISCDAYIINAKKGMKYAERANKTFKVGNIAYNLASIFEQGSYHYGTQKCPKDKVLALKYFEISANNDNREAAKIAADYFYKSRQYKKAFNYYLKVLNDYSESMFTTQKRNLEIASIEFKIGFMYENGIGTKKDIANAMAYYSKAANKGLIEAKHNLSVLSKRSGSFLPL